MRSIASNLTPQRSCVGAARKVSPDDWLQKTMTCHSFNCFSIVWSGLGSGLDTIGAFSSEQLLHDNFVSKFEGNLYLALHLRRSFDK